MQRYADFAPTPFDHKGAFLDDRDDWLVVPVSQTRDSGPMEQSNFDAALAFLREADPAEEDFERHRFGHWGPGWFEILIVRPDSAAHKAALDIIARLENYPLLDEDDVSNREWDEVTEAWLHSSVRDRVEMLQYAGGCIFAARRDDFPEDPQGRIFDQLVTR